MGETNICTHMCITINKESTVERDGHCIYDIFFFTYAALVHQIYHLKLSFCTVTYIGFYQNSLIHLVVPHAFEFIL